MIYSSKDAQVGFDSTETFEILYCLIFFSLNVRKKCGCLSENITYVFFGGKMNSKFMEVALKEAKKAYKLNEVPVGAVIVKDNVIISKAYNLREKNNSSLSHAEILCIKKACKKLGTWRLEGCDMYVTLEPCSMCAGAIINSRIKNVYIGASDEKTGAVGSVLNLFTDYKFNHNVNFEKGILEDECKNLLQEFFKELRKEKLNKRMFQKDPVLLVHSFIP